MLSLLAVVCALVYTASGQIGGHSPFLASPRVTGIKRHGDHYDAHVHHDVVDHHGNVHTIHRDVPIASTIGTVNPYGYNRVGMLNGYNNYNNYNNYPNYNNYNRFGYNRLNLLNGFRNSIYPNTYRQPYVTTNTGDFHGHHHGHRHRRAALLPVARYPMNELFPDISAKSEPSDYGKENANNQDKRNETPNQFSENPEANSESENRPILLLSSSNEIVNTLIINPSEFSSENSDGGYVDVGSDSSPSRQSLDSESNSNSRQLEPIKNFKSQLSNLIDSVKKSKEERREGGDRYKPREEESIRKSSFPLPPTYNSLLPSFKTSSYKEDSDQLTHNWRYNNQMRLGFNFSPRRSRTFPTSRRQMSDDTDYLPWPFRRFSGLMMLNECRNRQCGYNSFTNTPYFPRLSYPFYLPTVPQPPFYFW